MTKQRRSFPLSSNARLQVSCPIKAIAKPKPAARLGWSSPLRRWVIQLQQECNGVTPQRKVLAPEQQKIQQLEARIARLGREKSILKKATALLMSDEHERTR